MSPPPQLVHKDFSRWLIYMKKVRVWFRTVTSGGENYFQPVSCFEHVPHSINIRCLAKSPAAHVKQLRGCRGIRLVGHLEIVAWRWSKFYRKIRFSQRIWSFFVDQCTLKGRFLSALLADTRPLRSVLTVKSMSKTYKNLLTHPRNISFFFWGSNVPLAYFVRWVSEGVL